MRSESKKKKLDVCFGQFKLSGDLESAKNILFSNTSMDYLDIEFKFSSDTGIQVCQLHVLEKKDRKGRLSDDVNMLMEKIACRGIALFSALIKLAKENNLRVGYSLVDTKPVVLKIFIFFEEGPKKIKKSLQKLLQQFNMSPKIDITGDQIRFIGFEFEKSASTVSIYKYLKGGIFRRKNGQEFFSGRYFGKEASYFSAKKFSAGGEVIYNKIYENYNFNSEGTQDKKNIEKFFGNKKFVRSIYKNFNNFRISALGLKLDDGRKDIYICPNK